LLVSLGADVEAKAQGDGRPLHAAAVSGKLESVKHLLDAGASVHARDLDGRTPLHVAAHHNQTEIVELLLEAGASPTAKDSALGLSALQIARKHGFADAFEDAMVRAKKKRKQREMEEKRMEQAEAVSLDDAEGQDEQVVSKPEIETKECIDGSPESGSCIDAASSEATAHESKDEL